MNGILRNLILAAALTAAPALAFAQEGGEEKGGEQKAEGPDNKAKAQMFVDEGLKRMASFLQTRNQNEMMLARQCFAKALELDKTNFDALLGVSEMMMLEANTGAAAAKLTEAVKVKPKHQKAQYLLGSVLLKLERYEKAVEALKAAYEADEGLVQDAETQVMIPFEYGKCLARMGKAEEGAKVLRELAEGGKFEIFGSYKDARQNLYFEGYQMVGEAYMGMGQYQEADRFLTKAVANCKQLHEGKMTAELQSAYVYNKFRVPIPSVGQMEGDVFLHVASKLKIQKPKDPIPIERAMELLVSETDENRSD
ncbi:MAG: tetratricopeptide repeat protein, partial [Planctomycetes bacterium]|nr:tetratricopeptide repeat protein [Planctomycetota bacterium]